MTYNNINQDGKNGKDSMTIISNEELENNEKERDEIKLQIIQNIITLKEKISNYKKLSSGEKSIDKQNILGELNIIKKYFQDIIGISKQYLKNNLGIIDDTELNNVNGFIDKENSLISAIDNIDSKVLSITLLIELFELKGFQNFGDIKTFLEEESRDGLEKNTKKMEQFDSNDTNTIGLISKLNNYGEAKYEENKGVSKGPILVIYPEAHYAGPILKNNYEAIINSQEYYNFLATEGAFDEIKDIPINSDDINKLISSNEISLSSIAIEAVLKEQIKTFGVESYDFLGIMKKIIQNNKESTDEILERFKKKIREGRTYGEDIKSNSNPDNLDDFFKNVVIKYRNYFWLKNIQNELINGSTNGKNFVPIVCGAIHTQDLISQSKNMGFKGVITFEPNAYKEKMDIGFVESYLKHQMQ